MDALPQIDRMTVAPSLSRPHEGYMPGFGNDFETEALPGALPVSYTHLTLPTKA